METNIEERYDELCNENKRIEKRIDEMDNNLNTRFNAMKAYLSGQI